MSILSAPIAKTPRENTHENSLFSIRVDHKETITDLLMSIPGGIVNTKDLSATYRVLSKQLPSILSSTCYNELNLPFRKEVIQTEIGHLFEHILLEYLCSEKLSSGRSNAVFVGETAWNWYRDPMGTFHIRIKAGHKYEEIFNRALRKTILLTREIFDLSTKQTVN